MGVPAGRKNRRFSVIGMTDEVDELNAPAGVPYEVVRVWGWVKGESGMASVRQSTSVDGLARSLNNYSVRIGFRPNGIDSAMWIAEMGTGVVFDIKQVRHDFERREWTDIVCEQGNKNGEQG